MGSHTTTMVFDKATGMLQATPGQKTSWVLNAPVSGIAASKSNPVCFQYFKQKPGNTLQQQLPQLYNVFMNNGYHTNITVPNNNGNCAGRGFHTQIQNPSWNGSVATSASFFVGGNDSPN